MRYIFNFPDIGEGLEEGTILEWYVTKGQTVSTGDPLVKMETDKVVADIPSPKDRVQVQPGLARWATWSGWAARWSRSRSRGICGGGTGRGESGSVPEPEEKAETVVGTMEVASHSAILPASSEGVTGRPVVKQQSRHKVLSTPVARAMVGAGHRHKRGARNRSLRKGHQSRYRQPQGLQET